MTRPGLLILARAATTRSLSSARLVRPMPPRLPSISPAFPRALVAVRSPIFSAARSISTTPERKGITPDNKPVDPKQTEEKVITAANITDAEFHKAADEYLERLLSHLERIQDEREEVDVEYSAGVLTVSFGEEIGTYVINKQPPNKQIWLSSPKSGPKRYDLVVLGDGMNDKQDTAASDWMYMRDKTTMNQLFIKELGIDLRMPVGHYGE